MYVITAFLISDRSSNIVQRAKRQENIALEKLSRAQQHAEERRYRSTEELERLQREYAEMSEERKENDRMVEETKQEADALERKVQGFSSAFICGRQC